MVEVVFYRNLSGMAVIMAHCLLLAHMQLMRLMRIWCRCAAMAGRYLEVMASLRQAAAVHWRTMMRSEFAVPAICMPKVVGIPQDFSVVKQIHSWFVG